MTRYKHFILPAVLVGTAAAASVFATFMADRLRHTRETRLKTRLANWEDEGGTVLSTDESAP